MTRKVFKSDLPYPFSAAVESNGLLFVSGQVGIRDGKTGDGIEVQTRMTLDNMREVLERAGSSLERVLKVTVFMTDMALWPKMNEVYREYFPNDPPARSALGANALALPELLVEIECIAEAGD
jgi:2-iminobutanoate/2-iminopropanoate deaminase